MNINAVKMKFYLVKVYKKTISCIKQYKSNRLIMLAINYSYEFNLGMEEEQQMARTLELLWTNRDANLT